MKKVARCYGIQDVPGFFLESSDPSWSTLQLHLGEQEMELTREAFYSFVGSLAKIAVDLLENGAEPPTVH
ncbi:hypothetical protein K2X33_06500 [bacterium]|nr:hypothetical protein [bacterium]